MNSGTAPSPWGRGGASHKKGNSLFHGTPGWGQQTKRAATARDDLRLIMQVHDELVFEIRPEAAPELIPRIVALMENAMTLSVPLIVETGLGANWDEAH